MRKRPVLAAVVVLMAVGAFALAGARGLAAVSRTREYRVTMKFWKATVAGVPTADFTEFEHPIQGDSERPFRELPITQSSERDHRRSAATSRRFGDVAPPFRVG